MKQIRLLQTKDDVELFTYAKQIGAPVALVQRVKAEGRLPVVNFAAGGVATPADAALMMQRRDSEAAERLLQRAYFAARQRLQFARPVGLMKYQACPSPGRLEPRRDTALAPTSVEKEVR